MEVTSSQRLHRTTAGANNKLSADQLIELSRYAKWVVYQFEMLREGIRGLRGDYLLVGMYLERVIRCYLTL